MKGIYLTNVYQDYDKMLSVFSCTQFLNNIKIFIRIVPKWTAVITNMISDFMFPFAPLQMQQELWTIDMGLSYGDSLAMFRLLEFTTGGKLDSKTHFFDVPPPKKEEKKSRRRRLVGWLMKCILKIKSRVKSSLNKNI